MIRLSVRKTSGIRGKVQGLIGASKPYALMLKTRFGIHTFGVKFPIDVLILNNQNRVTSMKEDLRPNKIFLWNPLYDKVIELPAGTIKEKGIKLKSEVRPSL